MPRPSKPTGSPTYPKRKAQARMKPFVPRRPNAQRLLNKAEVKGIDTNISTLVDSTTEVITNTCNLITQGDSFNNREGATVMIKSVQIQGRVTQVPAAAATSAGVFYLWVVLDKQPNGAALTATGATGYLTTTTANEALPTIPMQYRFKTLGKIVIPMNSQAGVTTAYNNRAEDVSWYYKFKTPLEVRFTANAGTIADIATNNIALVCGASDTDDTMSFGGTVRVRFTG